MYYENIIFIHNSWFCSLIRPYANFKGRVSTDIGNMEYGHEAEEYIFLNLPFPSNPKEIFQFAVF